jgi:hypothetical protein
MALGTSIGRRYLQVLNAVANGIKIRAPELSALPGMSAWIRFCWKKSS